MDMSLTTVKCGDSEPIDAFSTPAKVLQPSKPYVESETLRRDLSAYRRDPFKVLFSGQRLMGGAQNFRSDTMRHSW